MDVASAQSIATVRAGVAEALVFTRLRRISTSIADFVNKRNVQ